jgi:rhodanese-related sulfurtransferase
VALKLKDYGIANARPIAGGLDEWLRRGLPVEKIA